MRLAAALVLFSSGCDVIFLGDPPKCPDEYGESTYLLVTTERKWSEAERSCRDLMGGNEHSHLAVIGSAAELAAVQMLTGTSDYYVGLTNRRDGVFRWITTETTFIPWAPGQPGDNANAPQCGVLYDDGLHDDDCEVINDYICECDGFDIDKDRL